ncbi:MAG TPA: hypothetical protein VEH10_02895 [Thermoplasmata archaeon]|nr:hypothetical protein [Thermoplasmata archaeon]
MDRVTASPRHSRQRWVLGLVAVAVVAVMLGSTFAAAFTALGAAPRAPGLFGAGPTTGTPPGGAPVTPAAKAPATLNVTPTAGSVGSQVTFNVSHFNHGAAITVKNAKGTILCGGTTSSTGTFSCTYVIPAVPGGNYTYSAATGADSASAVFEVVPHLVTSPSTGLVGTPFTLIGTGFPVSTTDKVQVNWTAPGGVNTIACSKKTAIDANGTFTCPYTMPQAPAGPHLFYAFALNSTGNGSANGSFTVVPGLTVGPTHGSDGTLVTFSGTGFADQGTTSVNWTGGTGFACSNSTLSTGSFSCSFRIPGGTPGGPYVFTASGGGGTVATTTFIVTYLAVAPVAAPVNATVQFTGAGFAPSSNVTLSWVSLGVKTYACNPGASSPTGTYNCTFRIPYTPTAPYVFNASDAAGDYATTVLTVEPSLVLSPNYGPNGTTVSFNGTGFSSDSTVTVTWTPNGSVPATAFSATTSPTGGFVHTFTVNVSAGGPYVFTATDAQLHSATATFGVSNVAVTPSRGPTGTTVVIQASGFKPSSSITLSSDFAITCTSGGGGKTDAEGDYSCTAAIPNAPAGLHRITAQVGTDTANGTFTVLPHLWTGVAKGVWTSPTKQKPGFAVYFAPTGFAKSSALTLTWTSNGTVVCSVTTSASGAVNCTLPQVPSIPAGPYSFTATDAASNTAVATVVVIPGLSVSPSSGNVGASVVFTGDGYAASTTVNVTSILGLACTRTTDASGSFSCSYTVPSAQNGTYTFTGTDVAGNAASAAFKVGALLTLAPVSGPVGTLIAFTGTGFGAGLTGRVFLNYSASKPAVLACSGLISSAGGFSCTYAFPGATPGKYSFTAADGSTYPKKPWGNNSSASFTLTPSLTVTPSSGGVGTAVTFQGQGYPASQGVSVLTSSGGIACSSTTNVTGTFSCAARIGPAPAGPDVFTATVQSESASATFSVVSQLALAPARGAVGTAIALNGSGFPAFAPVSISWTGGTACAATASATGAFSCPTYVVPATPAGTYVFTATVNGSSIATASFTVVAGLTLSPGAGPVGTLVTFRATGFAPSVSISVSSSLGAACSGSTASNGSFTCTYTVPAAPSGSYAFTATDGTNRASASFTLGTVLSVSPALGIVGTPIRFTATAFAASTPITVSWSGGTVCSGTTGPAGGYICNASMPAASLGSHTFTATAGPSATTTFTVRPALTVTPGSGGSGSTITFTGTGFLANDSVTVSWTGPTTCSNTTGPTGGFSCSLKIPLGTAGGVYPFTATDTASDTATATFEVVTGLSASPDHGPAGTAVTFTGTNFAANSAVSVTSSLGTACPAATTKTNASGGFTCAYPIPSGTAGGTYNFTATDAASNSASVLFVVTFLTATPNGVEIGTSVALAGGGFAPDAAYSVTGPWGSVPGCSGTTTADGAFSCHSTVPGSATPGRYNFSATDGTDVATAGFGVFTIAAPTAVPGSADVAQAVTFSVAATGGGTLTYVWSGLPNGCTSSSASFSCNPGAAVAEASITVQVTDVTGYSVTSPALVFTVYADPTQAHPTPSRASADIGQTVTFTASVSGGSGGGAYAWTSAAALNCSASTGPTLSCVPTGAGSLSVSYVWTDSNGEAATGSTSLSYTVHLDPSQAAPTPSRGSADVGQTVTFAASVSGGSGGGTYAWTFATALNCTTTTGASLSCTPNGTGALALSYVWTDSNGVVALGSTSFSFTVDPHPTAAPPTPSITSAEVGQPVTFTASVSGGSGGGTYAWTSASALNCTLTTGPVLSCTPSGTGSLTVSYVWTDSNGVATTTSTTLTFTVRAGPALSAVTSNRTSADVGQTLSFTTTPSGGTGVYTFTWAGPAGLNCTVANASQITCVPATPGTYSVSVYVVDSNRSRSATVDSSNLVVYADPSVTVPSPSQPSRDAGQTVMFSTTLTGGLAPVVYTWTASSSLGCTLGHNASIMCTPAAGTWTVTVSAKDANGVVAHVEGTSYTVDPTPAVTNPVPSAKTVDVGQTVTFTTTPSGGTGVYTFSWTDGSGLNCSLVNAPSISCTPNANGSFVVTVRAVDTNGAQTQQGQSASFTVFADPAVTSLVANRTSADVSQLVMFNASINVGSGKAQYLWSSGANLGCVQSFKTPNIYDCVPKQPGTYTVGLNITDSNGATSQPATLAFTVYGLPNATAKVSPTSVLQGKSVTFTGTASGGLGPYTFIWAELPAGCTAAKKATISCSPSDAGTFLVLLDVKDANNGSALVNVTLTVQASFLGLPAIEGYGIVLGAIAAGVVALVLVMMHLAKKRRGKRQQMQF